MSNRGELVGGRYALVELLGEGAFAYTYRAHDIRLRRDVALKILRSSFARDAAFATRFTREAVAVASISHRNVVQVFDHGPHEDTLFIAMEFVAGQTLRQLRLDAGGRLAVSEAVELVVQLLRGLQAVHRAGIIHRDIKPENILIGHDGIARLADFGIATDPTGSSLTITGTTLGTAAYMAPEQARGEELTPAADVYAVGVVLFELLTGRLPFPQDNTVAMMLAHQQVSPPSLRHLAPGAAIPARLDAIVLASLAKSADLRFRSAQEMERALISRDEMVTQQLERTAQLPTLPHTRQPQSRPAARSTFRSGSRFGRGWVILLVLLALVAGSAVVAAWWANQGDGDRRPATPTPRVLDAVSDDPIETLAIEATEPANIEPVNSPTPTAEPDPTGTSAPIVPVATETDAPEEQDTRTPTPDIPKVDLFDPTPSEVNQEFRDTPTPNGDSPPIEPLD